MFGNINWQVAIDTALGTIADREDEMRKASAEVLRTVHKDRVEQVSSVREENKELRKEIDRKVGLLRSEGLTDNMIASAIDAFGADAFTVIGQNLETFKKENRESYDYLKRNNLLTDLYKKEFDLLLEQAGDGVTRDLTLDTAKATLMKDLPQLTMPEVTESQFGFQYSKKLRDQIAQAGSDIADVPEYDRGAPVSGLSEMFTGLVSEVPSAANLTTDEKVRKAVQQKLLGRYGSLKKASLSDVFETSAQADVKERNFVSAINSLVDKISRDFMAQRRDVAPGELAGKVDEALTDAELLEKIFGETSLPEEPEGKDDAVLTGNINQSISNFVTNNSGTATADFIIEIQKIPNVTDQQVQDILKAIASGTPFGTAISNAGLDPNDPLFASGSPFMNRIQKQLQNFDPNVVNTQIFGASPSPAPQSVSGPKQPGGSSTGPKSRAWENVYGPYFNPDGSVKDTQTYDTPQKIQDLLNKLGAEFKKKYPNMTL